MASGLNDKDTVQVTLNPETSNSSVNIYVAGMENNLPVSLEKWPADVT
jgi:hypothetical protein